MNLELGFLASASLVTIAVSFLVAAFSRLLHPIVRASLDRLAPTTRASVFWLWATLPALLGLIVLLVVLLPSFAHLLGIATDHCLEHGHHGHLCLVHSPLFLGNAIELVFLLVSGMFFSVKLSSIGLRYVRGYQSLSALWSLSDRESQRNYCLLSSHRYFAFTAGLIRPRIFISRRLADELDHDEFNAVLMHEENHRRRYDGLRKLCAQVLSLAHFGTTRSALLNDLELAIEQAADDYAAKALGNRFTVAEAIVKMSRLSILTGPHSGIVTAFNTADPTRRVLALLNPPISHNRSWSVLGFAVLMAICLSGFMAADFLHHGVESIFGAHFG